jgi:hypothetical protein
MGMNCTLCNEPIPTARLKAVPSATECVPCLTKAGDVPTIKRFDQYIAKGGEIEDVVEITYKGKNQYIDAELAKLYSSGNYSSAWEEAKPFNSRYKAPLQVNRDLMKGVAA